jgi:hypothetical protein
LFLKDSSILEVKDYRFKNNERKYSYHWMTKDRQLIIRWDNAEHWREISTFPHHKHISQKSNVQPSIEINLDQILKIIEIKLIKNN